MAVAFSIPAVDYLIASGDEEYVSYDPNHPEIAAARLAAKNSLNHFRTALESAENKQVFYIEVEQFTTSGAVEVVTLANVSFLGADEVTGVLSHRPLNRLRGNVSKGDSVTVPIYQVTDWSYWDGDRRRGAYSDRVFLKLQKPQNRQAIEATLHESPLP